ncbi:MAG: PqqD family peptide modification chaperone [Phycisphaerales bacterium JB037]
MADRPTFSPMWHRVRALKPRLRPHVQITRQHYRGKRWHVVHDPATNQFYRLNPIAHEFVGLLDGTRTVESVWELSLQRHGDRAPTQQEAIQLISQLYGSNLLSVDATPETEQLLRRGRERVKKKVIGQAIGIMYFKIRLFNPDALITWIEPMLRPVLNRFGFFAWVAFLIFVGVNLAPAWGRLTGEQFSDALSPANWGWMIVVFIVTKAIHELGHGVILKRYGGQCPEFGVMLLVMFPAPYVDASSAWALENKWKRMGVGAGGMIFELFVAGVAALVWLNTQSGQLVHQLAYNAMFIASISTILFNANPLMRFDGYYILSDLIEVPNLMQRSQNMIKHFFKKFVYGLKNETPPTTNPTERAILVVYGIAAIAYRLFLFVTITLYVMGQMFAVGLLLAIWTASMWFILPVGKFVQWLASSPALSDKRVRAIATSLGMIALVGLSLGAVPVPDWRRATGVVEARQRSGVFFGVGGFVTGAHVRPGEFVRAGQPLVTIENAELVSQLASGRAERRRYESLLRQVTEEQPIAVDIYRQTLEALNDQIAFMEEREAKLVVRAPHDGIYVGVDPDGLVGSWVEEGQGLAEIVDVRDLHIVANLDQQENSWLIQVREGELPVRVEMRLVSAAHTVVPGGIERIIPAGQRRLAHGALGYAGGGPAQIDQQDQTGTLAKRQQFVMEVSPLPVHEGDWIGLPGERVRLRFTLPSKPILVQFGDRLHKMVQGRVNL